MLVDSEYWYFWTSKFDKKTCEKIIKLGKSKQPSDNSYIGMNKEGSFNKTPKRVDKKIRNSGVTWLNDQRLYDLIAPFFKAANNMSGWKFQYDWFEEIQFTSYEKNQHYDWHCDIGKTHINNKIRKLSCVINLTDPKKFKGGDFYFALDNPSGIGRKEIKFKELKNQGTVVVFPSFVFHKVKPITQGNRYSLVIWGLGESFK